jgi:hypothetical protein
VEPTGKFVYVVNSFDGTLSAYSIGSTGALTPIGSRISVGPNPRALAISGCAAPPAITDISTIPEVLWPPNHKMVDVTVRYNVTARCGTPTCNLAATSNERKNGSGNGDTYPDWILLDPHQVELRAERTGMGTGRIYTITIACQDTSGHLSSQSAAVLVPHGQEH